MHSISDLTRYPLKLLVVDNDPLVRLGTAMMLRELGCSSKYAHNARRAMDILRGGYAPHIVVTDYSMPGGKNGVQLAREINAYDDEIDILIMTGHNMFDEPADPHWGVLEKPFNMNELDDAVSAILSAKDAPFRRYGTSDMSQSR